jgi:hypothetical protein
MIQQQTPEYVQALRLKLSEDADRASAAVDKECRQDWIDPLLWKQYAGVDGRHLYNSYTDEELLDFLREAAARLGRAPTQKEVFCVYRSYIRRRFTNWPAALRAAGLKAPKRKWRNDDEQES